MHGPEVLALVLAPCTAAVGQGTAHAGTLQSMPAASGWPLQGMAQKQQSAQQSELSSSSSREGDMHWQARFAVLSLLATFLRLSPGVQRRAVREWDIVKALFALVGEPDMQQAALRMVRQTSLLWWYLCWQPALAHPAEASAHRLRHASHLLRRC